MQNDKTHKLEAAVEAAWKQYLLTGSDVAFKNRQVKTLGDDLAIYEIEPEGHDRFLALVDEWMEDGCTVGDLVVYALTEEPLMQAAKLIKDKREEERRKIAEWEASRDNSTLEDL